MFSDVRITLNGKNVHQRTNNYHYKRYIEKLVSFDEQTKQTALQASGYYEDSPGAVSVAFIVVCCIKKIFTNTKNIF